MAIGLAELEESQIPEGLTIERVANRKKSKDWNDVFSIVFEVPNDLAQKTLQFFEMVDYSIDATLEFFIGTIASRVVATSTVCYTTRSVVVSGISVLNEYRGKGIGRAMTIHLLLLGRQKGYKLGVLASTKMGYPVYEKLGFREYCKVANYVGDFS